MNNKIDFSICELIETQMWFFTYYDFCDNRKKIKQLFDKMTKQQKRFYKWYVYSNMLMNETFKNLIWNYLNNYDKNGKELIKAKKNIKKRCLDETYYS